MSTHKAQPNTETRPQEGVAPLHPYGTDGMYVTKRSGLSEPMDVQKITQRLERLMWNLDTRHVQVTEVVRRVQQGMYSGISSRDLDNLAAETAAALTVHHPDYALLAARIAVSNLHKETNASFRQVVEALFRFVNPKNNEPAPMVSEQFYRLVQEHADVIDAHLEFRRDYDFDYFGFKTLEKSYLMRLDGKIVERPQHLFMRVALGIHQHDLAAAFETYDLMSQKWFVHATPTLFNAGTPKPQMSSCFLLAMKDDSIEGIYDTLKQSALISQSAGGVGISISNIRSSGAYIRGTGGTSNGLVPMLRVFNDTARYVDQGGGKRKGAFAMYLEPWHPDIFHFLELKKNHGKEEMRARDLFYGLWIPDLFMKRVKENSHWSLFDPQEAPGLVDCWGKEFEALYERYEQEGRARQVVKAQDLWFQILDSQIETGTPYLLYKDHANGKSNQQNLGTIRSSNLCTEIIEYTSPDEVAVCNLASIALNRFIVSNEEADGRYELSRYGDGWVDHKRLFEISRVATKNLNKIIDLNYYPVPEAQRSNMRHRPIGIGVQGLADAFIALRLPFESDEARRLNRDMFETIYFGALTASMELAAEHGTYETYAGSPASKGQLQFDLWGVQPTERWDWAGLKQKIAEHGLRNSLLVAPMPTASTSQILGNNECIEPYTSNLYTRRVLSGEFIVVNKHLLRDLVERNLWNEQMRQRIIAGNGSIQHIAEIPAELRDLYKTVWEIKQKALIDLAADRGAFICQSQSMNLFVQEPNYAKLTSMHFYGWERGLKTGMYYLRTKAATEAIKFTVDSAYLQPELPLELPPVDPAAAYEGMACALDNPGACEACGS